MMRTNKEIYTETYTKSIKLNSRSLYSTAKVTRSFLSVTANYFCRSLNNTTRTSRIT